MAFGVNSSGTVVGTDGNGNAFSLTRGAVKTFVPAGGMSATAFGINDNGAIVGQYVTSDASPGFVRINSRSTVTINASFGTEHRERPVDQQHRDGGPGSTSAPTARTTASWRARAVARTPPSRPPRLPTRPSRPWPGNRACSTFVFSPGPRDQRSARHHRGLLRRLHHQPARLLLTIPGPEQCTFLDDPSEAFNSGVEVTQIPSIQQRGRVDGVLLGCQRRLPRLRRHPVSRVQVSRPNRGWEPRRATSAGLGSMRGAPTGDFTGPRRIRGGNLCGASFPVVNCSAGAGPEEKAAPHRKRRVVARLPMGSPS